MKTKPLVSEKARWILAWIILTLLATWLQPVEHVVRHGMP